MSINGLDLLYDDDFWDNSAPAGPVLQGANGGAGFSDSYGFIGIVTSCEWQLHVKP